jgi:hypothetical protein
MYWTNMPKAKNITSQIKRGSLIHYSLDGIKRESFDVIKTELASLLKRRAGVYALYYKTKLVRVGLGTNIYWRVKGHARNRHENKFSFIGKDSHLSN